MNYQENRKVYVPQKSAGWYPVQTIRYSMSGKYRDASCGIGCDIEDCHKTAVDGRKSSPYETDKKGVSGGKSVSFICAFCGRNGIVIASDSRSSKTVQWRTGKRPEQGVCPEGI